MTQMHAFVRQQEHQQQQKLFTQEPEQQLQQRQLIQHSSTVVSISSPTHPRHHSDAMLDKKRVIDLDSLDDCNLNANNANNNNDDDDDDIVNVRYASTSVKRRRVNEPELTADEQRALDELEAQRASLYEKARQRKQQAQQTKAKLQSILADPTSQEYALLLSILK